MIRKHKKTLILTSLLTLLPILIGLLLRDKLPEMIPTHWGFDGQPDGWSSASTAILVMPLIMLAIHWVCAFFTSVIDKSNQDRNEKMQVLVFWIIPILSNLCCGLMYALALGADLSITNVMFAFMGLLFALIGNYMPKCKMNATIGIKVYWAYTSEENWNATHRLGGKVWFIGGLLMLFTALIPAKYAIVVSLAVTAVMVIIPIVYSWQYYRKQLARGDELTQPLRNKKATRGSPIALAIVLILIAFLMFTGDIDVVFGEDSFTIEASFHKDLTVAYDAIDSAEYREGNVEGYRVMGYGSARLLLGTFENEEFGRYTRYTYTNPDGCIVLTSGDQVLVFCGKDAQETQNIYSYLAAIMRNR